MRVLVCRRVRACVPETTPRFSFLFFFALLAAVAYSYGHYGYACVDHS